MIIISDPIMASGLLTLFLAAAILVSGVTRMAVAFQHRDQKGWGWLLFGGVVAVVLGLMIATKWPASSFFVIGLFIAIELIVNGWALVTLALAARAVHEAGPSLEQPA
ncbi:MAG: HdeD family acid-resistance protein [Myxococcota bacterium]